MQIILLQDIRGLGRKNDTKDVADGYARNLLFPNGLAKPATASELKKLAELKEQMSKEDKELEKRLREIAKKINETALEFKVKTDKSGSVFGSIGKEQILSAMRDAKLIFKERVDIKLDHPIKEIGEHSVAVDLKKGALANLKILVKPE